MDKARVHIYVAGKVQNVFYRNFIKRKASTLNVTGWVKNISDGRVEAVLEGEKDKIEELVNWAKKGPMFAKVDEIEVISEEYKGEFDNFEIRCD